MSQPRLSIVICAYNEAPRVEDCITALLAQDLPTADFEVIFVDDGSRDGTLDLVRSHLANAREALPHIRLLPIAHAGLGRARNTGISAARGEVIAFTDADAAPAPDWARRILQHFTTRDDADVLGGRVDIINPESSVARLLDRVHYEASDVRDVIGCNMAFRASFFRRHGGFHPDFHSRGDETELLRRAGRVHLSKDDELRVRHERPESLRAWTRERHANGRFFAWSERLEAAPNGRRALGRLRTFGLVKRAVTLSPPLFLVAGFLAPIAVIGAVPGVLATGRRIHREQRVARTFASSPRRRLAWTLAALGLQLIGDAVSDLGWICGAFERPGPSPLPSDLAAGHVVDDETFGEFGATPVASRPKEAAWDPVWSHAESPPA